MVLAAAAMLFAVGLAYGPARAGEFVWDDHALVERDGAFRHVPLGQLFVEPFWPESALSDARAAYYRPLVLLSLRLDMALGGTPVELHFTNVLLHLVACALLATVAARLGASGAAGVLAALAWGLAPRLTESVAWVSGRTDVLAGALSLGALALSPDAVAGRAPDSGRAWARTALSGVCLFGALASKEVAVAAALALAAAALWPRAGDDAAARGARRRRLALGVVLPLAVYAALRAIALAGMRPHHRELGVAGRAFTVLEALARYVEMTVDALRPTPSIGMLGEVDTARAAAGGVVLAAASALAWRARSRAPFGVVVAGVLGAGALGLVLHVVPFSMSGAVSADRLLYLPLAALVIALAVAATGLSARASRLAAGVALALAAVFLPVTHARAATYQDEVRFWVEAAERAHPHNTMARSALAGVVRDAGQTELACRLFDAVRAIQERSGREGTVTYRRARENAAACWARLGRYDEARAVYEALVRENPEVGRVYMGLAFVKLHQLDFDGAEQDFRRAVALDLQLAAFVRPALTQLAAAKADAPAHAGGAAAGADPVRRASFFVRVGRLADAEEAFVAIADDPAASARARHEALYFLVRHGSVPHARRAAEACSAVEGCDLMDGWERLSARERRWNRVAALRARIEALASPCTGSA